VRWIGGELIKAVYQGLHKEPPPRPKAHKPSDQYLDRVDVLRSWRKATARKMKVESDVIMPKDLLYELAEQNPKSPSEVETILQEVPWRLNKFGEEIFYLLRASD
jgi:ribonuclease D